MTITVRPATMHDAGSACAVLRRSIVECCAADHRGDPPVIEAWLWNKTPENVRTWLGVPGSFAVVAEVRGEIVGFALCSADGEVLLCYVVQEVRFTGAGKALLRAIEAHAIEVGLSALRLESTRTALPFYARNGFVPSGAPTMVFGIEGQPMSKRL